VVGSLTPGQALVGVVHEELARLMGGPTPRSISRHSRRPSS
jgi:signal recognition particle GTPase